ncbi:MAG: hypothetical protein CSB47_08435 [Proteobacteria bacterium]|nr:MAG: hypothetical protein CSB47_08435 [Pseudomonadota bacterium]
MKLNLSLLGGALLASSVVLVGCDSVTATHDKAATEAEKKGVGTPKAVVEKVSETVSQKVGQTTETAVNKLKETTEAVAAKTAPAVAPKAQDIVDKPAFVEGQHYFEIFPTMQTDTVGGKVEVVELMWLGCPHCYELEPTMLEYKKNLPDYVDFKQVPALLNPRWAADGKLFYVAELLDPKGEKKLVEKVFHAMHVQRRRKMSSPDNMKNFMLQQGVSASDYDNVVNSMALTTKLNRAQQISADSQAQSVPSVVINGKYRTSPYAAGGNKQLMQLIDMLTKRELKSNK